MSDQKSKIIIRTDQHRDRAIELIKKAPVNHEVIIQPFTEKKTLPQLGYVYAVVYPTIIKFVADSYGEVFSVEEIHTYMKKQILGCDHKELEGVVIEIPKELKGSDKKAWSDYIDRVIIYAYTRWGLEIPPPYYREN